MSPAAARHRAHPDQAVSDPVLRPGVQNSSAIVLHNMSPSPTFVDLPTEVRLEIYQYYVLYLRRIHQRRQPTNRHFRLLRVCKQMYIEAKPIVSVYVSLLYERQIRLFTQTVPDDLVSLVVYADVANDGRLLRESDDKRSAGKYTVVLRLSQSYAIGSPTFIPT